MDSTKVQSLAARVEGSTKELQVVLRFVFIVAELTHDFFRLVDRVLLASACSMVPPIETPEEGHTGLGRLSIFSVIWGYSVGRGVEQRGDEGHVRRMMAQFKWRDG